MIDDKKNIIENIWFLKISKDLKKLYFKLEIKNGNKYKNIIDNTINMDELKSVYSAKRPPYIIGLLIRKSIPGIDKMRLNKQKKIIFLYFVINRIFTNKYGKKIT